MKKSFFSAGLLTTLLLMGCSSTPVLKSGEIEIPVHKELDLSASCFFDSVDKADKVTVKSGNLDIQKLGTYSITIAYGNEDYKLKVKIVDKEQFVTKTPKRARVWAVQTPQVFRYSIIRQAHEKARLGRMDGVTDDSMLVEKYGDCKVKMVEGSYENLKITTMEDLFVAEVILRGNEL